MKVLSVLRCFFVLFVCLLWVPSPLEERENCVEDQSTRIKKTLVNGRCGLLSYGSRREGMIRN